MLLRLPWLDQTLEGLLLGGHPRCATPVCFRLEVEPSPAQAEVLTAKGNSPSGCDRLTLAAKVCSILCPCRVWRCSQGHLRAARWMTGDGAPRGRRLAALFKGWLKQGCRMTSVPLHSCSVVPQAIGAGCNIRLASGYAL